MTAPGFDPATHWDALVAAVEGTDREVAGWIDDRTVHVAGRFAPDSFALDDAALLALARAATGPHPPRALFHSHPDGRAALSAADRAAWAPAGLPLHPWPQLVIATRGGRAWAAALYRWRDGGAAAVATYQRTGEGWR